MQDDEVLEGRMFGTFEKHKDFLEIQRTCLTFDCFYTPSEEDDRKEQLLFKKLSNILDEYQEQSYLLDPYLESMLPPVVDCLRSFAKMSTTNGQRGSPARVERLADLLYSYVKCRGYKTIIRFFPHEVADLSIALGFMTASHSLTKDEPQWALRYVVLTWLSLICMIPFDLAQFDEDGEADYTATAMEALSKELLNRAGLEREGSALLLARLYTRQDTSSRFPAFLQWSKHQIESNANIFTSIGILHVLCEVVKLGLAEEVRYQAPQFFDIANLIEGSSTLSKNTTVRKFKFKLASRVALRLLPVIPDFGRRKGRVLQGDPMVIDKTFQEAGSDVPEEVEKVLEQLFEALQDKDTVVRWSAAKGVARISERLSDDFADQVLETILGLFSIHSMAAASLYDLPSIAESTWHGACLACAEMGRRGLVAKQRLSELIEWLLKALYFDLKKGAHSIGSNVRDAAAYALWALARSQDASSLAFYSHSLAQRLIAVALYDREIHIRRAASAAFQEHVGRNSLFPHGIDVLGKTDFYAVSIRRNAFLTAAPHVAQYLEYRSALLNHVIDVVLRHWDPVMRELGAQSLHSICLADTSALATDIISNLMRLLDSIDTSDIHGGLLALSEIAIAYRDRVEPASREAFMQLIFRSLSRVPFDVLVGPRNAIVTAAACRLISITLTSQELQSETTSVPKWRQIIEHGVKHRVPSVQQAAAESMTSVSRLVDCSDTEISIFIIANVRMTGLSSNTLIRELSSGSPAIQTSLGTLLGAIDYSAHGNALSEAVGCILDFVQPSAPSKSNVEARRNCYFAIPKILSTVDNIPQYLSSEAVNSLYDSLINGLKDYTTDQRGDVGSWIRVACIRSLATVSDLLIQKASSIAAFDAYLPPSKYHAAVSCILKQGVERLPNVRQEAGDCLKHLMELSLPAVANPQPWILPGISLLKEIFSSSEMTPWSDAKWLFPKVVRLLNVAEYRPSILAGLVYSVGSRAESTQLSLAASLASYVKTLPLTDETGGYDMNRLAEDLIVEARSNMTSNAIVVPVLQTFNVLLEEGAMATFCRDSRGLHNVRQLLSMTTRNVSNIKSVARVQESMKIVVNLLAFPPVFEECATKLVYFLDHQYPTVRSNSAEYIYVFLQGADVGKATDEVEEILLETEWSTVDKDITKEAAQRVVELLCNAGLEDTLPSLSDSVIAPVFELEDLFCNIK